MSSVVASAKGRRLGSSPVAALLLTAIVVCVWAGLAVAGGGPRDVVIVVNRNSDASLEIGEYYRQARGIPRQNVCSLSCSTAEQVTWQECESKIREPIIQFLARPEIAGKVDYIVLTKGVPLKADYKDPTGPLSVSSVLLWPEDRYVDGNGDGKPDYKGGRIRFYYPFPYGPVATPAAPEVAWSHTLFDSNIPGDPRDLNRQYYLVCRLDAFTVDQVRTIIDRGLCPALDGTFCLDRNTLTVGAYGIANDNLGDQSPSAYDYLRNQGFRVVFDDGRDFVANQRGVMGYFSWSGNDHRYTFEKYTSNLFAPGAIGDSYYSTSCRTFADPGAAAHLPLMADLFALGLCGAGGYVSEPGVATATYPHCLFRRYTKGFNLAESFYAACPQAMWKTCVVGDPLLAPYATPPDVILQTEGAVMSGTETVTAFVCDDSGIKKVRFYMDDTLVATDFAPPFEIQLDTSLFPIGPHTLQAIAFENTAVETQGSAELDVVIENPISPVSHIADVFAYQSGQGVSLVGKIVTASTSEIGDSFYMEEPDRTSAIRVYGGCAVARGDIVGVVGPVATIAGERVITDARVTVTSSGSPLPEPFSMPLAHLGGPQSGSDTPAVGCGWGPRNTGLLVRVVGAVTSAGDGEFRISDGSTAAPVKVVCPGVTAPSVGAYVRVTGLSAVEEASPIARGAIRVRSASDISVIQ